MWSFVQKKFFEVTTVSTFKSHINDNHNNVAIERWYCPLQHCDRFFTVKKSYFKHVTSHENKPNDANSDLQLTNDPIQVESSVNDVANNEIIYQNVTLDQSKNVESIVKDTKLSFLKVTVGILADMTISRSKALEIVKKTHTHSMIVIENIRNICNQFIDFYTEEDISKLSEWYNYASTCIMSEYLIFKEIEKVNVHIPTTTH